tara:strand:- start:17 stop:157 length:141 start_codon:yes stop_codon:yes gene_type:complete
MPKPRKQEKQSEYIIRCVADSEMENKYPDRDQRLAVCYSYWRDRNK